MYNFGMLPEHLNSVTSEEALFLLYNLLIWYHLQLQQADGGY